MSTQQLWGLLLMLQLCHVHYITHGVAHDPSNSVTKPPEVSATACPGCPYFLATAAHITTSVGLDVNLTCGVRRLGDRQVSWIRRRDLHVLTTGNFTYTTDLRFTSLHEEGSPYWVLRVQQPTLNDPGVYECQVAAQPKVARKFTLSVIVPRAEILGSREVFMKAGSGINITCVITGVPPEKTVPVTWLHTIHLPGGRSSSTMELNSGSRGGVQVTTDRLLGTSQLLVTMATGRDAGNYTCVPHNAEPASVLVHVVDEKHPEAIQPALEGSSESPDSALEATSSAYSCSMYKGVAHMTRWLPNSSSFLIYNCLYALGYLVRNRGFI
ncbi:unnamed protein product [Meganyctiphanes norvegica]|uniref:Ig-like domain-containing protein n=1 Tax=Meganyctiphanes norvegica TaxID=48144 RepID=A0AAV2Q951_MEGNR